MQKAVACDAVTCTHNRGKLCSAPVLMVGREEGAARCLSFLSGPSYHAGMHSARAARARELGHEEFAYEWNTTAGVDCLVGQCIHNHAGHCGANDLTIGMERKGRSRTVSCKSFQKN